MWRRRGHGRNDVICIACGSTIDRSDAWEYDKHGDRWDREGKEFEHLCKPCHGDLCRQPRSGLEEMLIEIGAGERTRDDFLAAYAVAISESTERESER